MTLLKIRYGVYRAATNPDLEVQVGAGAVAGAAHRRYLTPPRHALALRDQEGRQVVVSGSQPTPVLDGHDVAVARHHAHVGDRAAVGGPYGGPIRSSDVDAGVHPRTSKNGVYSEAKTGGDGTVGG